MTLSAACSVSRGPVQFISRFAVDNRVGYGPGAGALLRLQFGRNGVPGYC